jgi:NAD(P)-dependent dehydrogenase (short-subunit alcohol dehydrogenase family)
LQFLDINKIILETFLVLNFLARNGGGAIVNMLSVVSWFVNPFNAKHAALALTDAVRIQLKPQGTMWSGFMLASSTPTWRRG